MSYISETAANCAGILERGARRMAEAAKREAILRAEMQAALRATLADAPSSAWPSPESATSSPVARRRGSGRRSGKVW